MSETASGWSDSPTTGTTPSGPPSSPDAAEVVAGDRTLDAFEGSLGLPAECPRSVEVEATRLLTLAPDALRAMTAAQCGEAAYALEQFAFFLQRATNREQARQSRAEELLRRLLPPLLAGRREYMLEEKKLMAVADDPRAVRCERLRVEARLRLDRLAYLAARVGSLARVLLSVQQAKG